MQNKNNIKNWKIEITNEGAKLFITEGAVMARDVLNLAREQAIKYNLSNLKIYTVYMRDGYYYDYTFEDDMLYFIHMTEKIENEDISYLMKRAAEKLSTLKLDDRIWSVNFSIDNLPREKNGDLIEQCVRNTKLYDDTNTFDELNPVLTREVSVVDLDTVSAIFRYKRKEKRTAILNFASYKNAGGMFLQGSSAQEESLCHASFLYNVLSEFKDYYAWNDKHKNRALYENRALYSPDVVFTNDSVGTLCDVITCAAPNKSAAQKYCHVSDEENYNALESRIRFVLHIAEKEKVDTLILGAYGAGVFGQDATEVAQIFKRLLIEEFWTFEKIIFAIPDCSRNKNYKKFLDVMSDTIM